MFHDTSVVLCCRLFQYFEYILNFDSTIIFFCQNFNSHFFYQFNFYDYIMIYNFRIIQDVTYTGEATTEKVFRDHVEDICARLASTVTNNSIDRNMLPARNHGR